MTTPYESLFSEFHSAADLLRAPDLTRIADAVQAHLGSKRVELLILGESDGRHYALANRLLGEPLLPESLHPATSTPVRLDYESKTMITRHDEGGIVSVLTPPALLKTLYLHPEADSGEGVRLESPVQEIRIGAPRSFLEACRISLMSLEGLPVEDQTRWAEALCRADYVILVLKATAILSLAQKQVLRHHLIPALGPQRCALVIDSADALTAEEREEVWEFVRRFFERQEGLPPLLPYNSRPGNEDRGEADAWGEAIRAHIQSEVIVCHPDLRSRALRDGARLAVGAAERIGRLALEEATEANARLEQLQSQATRQVGSLSKRASQTRNRLELHLDSFLKESTLRGLEKFGEAIRQHLPGEIAAAGATTATAHALPGYLEALWGEHFRRLLPDVRAELIGIVKPILDAAAADVRAATGDDTASIQSLATELVLTTTEVPFHFPRLQMPPEGSKRDFVQNLSEGVSKLFGAITQTVPEGSPPSGADAFAQTVIPAVRQIEAEVKTETACRFSAITAQYVEAVAGFYQSAIDRLQAQVQQERDKQEHLLSSRAEIEALLATQVPQWKERVA